MKKECKNNALTGTELTLTKPTMIDQKKIEQAAERLAKFHGNESYEIDQLLMAGFRSGVRFAESEIGQIAQEFAELLYTWESKLELLNVSIANLSEAADPNTMTTFTVLQYQQMQLTQCIEGLRSIIAKFMAERN